MLSTIGELVNVRHAVIERNGRSDVRLQISYRVNVIIILIRRFTASSSIFSRLIIIPPAA
jgi:hypothetical protein